MKTNSQGAAALAQIPHSKTIIDRDDLSFTQRDEQGRLINWSVPHDKKGNWHDGIEIGVQHFSEVTELAKVSEYDAFCAIDFAISCTPSWSTRGSGIECGFSKALVAAAIVGLRALRAGAAPYDHFLEGKRLEAEEDGDL